MAPRPLARIVVYGHVETTNDARLTDSKRCISVLWWAFWGKGWGTLTPLKLQPSAEVSQCYLSSSILLWLPRNANYLPLSFSSLHTASPPFLSCSTSCSTTSLHANFLPYSPPVRPSGNALSVLSSDSPTYPNIPPTLSAPFLSSVWLTLTLFFFPPPSRVTPLLQQPSTLFTSTRFPSLSLHPRMYPMNLSFRLVFFLLYWRSSMLRARVNCSGVCPSLPIFQPSVLCTLCSFSLLSRASQKRIPYNLSAFGLPFTLSSRCTKFVLCASKTTLWIGWVTGFRKFDLYIPKILPGKSPVKWTGRFEPCERKTDEKIDD